MANAFSMLSLVTRRFGLKKQDIHISPFAYFDGECCFGNNVSVDRFCSLHNSRIGRYSYVGFNSCLSFADIEAFCSIANGVYIGLPKHPLSGISTSPVFYARNKTGECFHEDKEEHPSPRTTIGHDVWLGTNSLVMSGISIGSGAVIAAGAIVTKDVRPYSIVAGVPATEVRRRFGDDEIAEIERSKWWELSADELAEAAPFFGSVREFLSWSQSRRG